MQQDEKPPFRAPIDAQTPVARDEEIVLDWRDGATQIAIATKHKVSVKTVGAVIRRAVPQEERRARQRSVSAANRIGDGFSHEDVAAGVESIMRSDAHVVVSLWTGSTVEELAAYSEGRWSREKVRAVIREVRRAAEPTFPDMEHDRDMGLSYTALAAKYGLSPRACQRLIRARKVLAIANEQWEEMTASYQDFFEGVPHAFIRHELP